MRQIVMGVYNGLIEDEGYAYTVYQEIVIDYDLSKTFLHYIESDPATSEIGYEDWWEISY